MILDENQYPQPQNSFSPGRWVGVVLGLLVACLLVVCSSGATWLFSADTSCETGNGKSSNFDLVRARSYDFLVFSQGDWQVTEDVRSFVISLSRVSSSMQAVIYQEYLIYNCGYNSADIDAYYSDENFNNVILSNYQNTSATGSCEQGETRLYAFEGSFNDAPYLLWQWFEPDGDKRGRGVFMAFPKSLQTEMNEYAEKLFPALPACP